MDKTSKTSKKRERAKSAKTEIQKQRVREAMSNGISRQEDIAMLLGVSQRRVSTIMKEIYEETINKKNQDTDKAWAEYILLLESRLRAATLSSRRCEGQIKEDVRKDASGNDVIVRTIVKENQNAKVAYDKLIIDIGERIANAKGVVTEISKMEHDVSSDSNISKLAAFFMGKQNTSKDDFDDLR